MAPGIAGNTRRAIARRTEGLRNLLGQLPLPHDGMVVGPDLQILTAANWPHNMFTAPGGSVFIPDNSAIEISNPAQPLIQAYGV